GDPAFSAYSAAMGAVKDEFETFLQNNHALTESDKKAAQQIMDENSSPAQVQAALKQMAKTALIRLDALNERYRTVVGENYPALITPDGAQAASKLGYGKEISKYGVGGAVLSGGAGVVRIKASDGNIHEIPAANLDAARKIDPKLSVVQ